MGMHLWIDCLLLLFLFVVGAGMGVVINIGTKNGASSRLTSMYWACALTVGIVSVFGFKALTSSAESYLTQEIEQNVNLKARMGGLINNTAVTAAENRVLKERLEIITKSPNEVCVRVVKSTGETFTKTFDKISKWRTAEQGPMWFLQLDGLDAKIVFELIDPKGFREYAVSRGHC